MKTPCLRQMRCAGRLAPAALFALASCGSDDVASDPDGAPTGADGAPEADAAPPDAGPPAAGCTPTDSEDFALELVTDGLQEPLLVTSPPDDPRLFIVTQPGHIWIVDDGERLSEPFFDITGDVSGGFEQGLLGLAFHPDYADNGRFFVNYTDPGGETIVSEYQVSGDANAADADSEQPILEINQPASNHNGGMLAFGPDGYLYISTGDGGGADDEFDNGQDLETLHGTLLRIDVDAPGEDYGIPDDNPFVGDETARDEIWAYGIRNAWRFSFDREADVLYVGDVGQSAWEEIDAVPASEAGLNYGWPCFEGTSEHDPLGNCDALGEIDHTEPVYEYENENAACSVTGGYVYRGECLEALEGRYLFGDYCSGQIWSFSLQGGAATDVEELTDNLDPDRVIEQLSSFGQDAYGELYITSHGTGEVFRIIAADGE